MCDLIISELHDAYHVDWTSTIISNNVFSYPETSFSTRPQNFKTKFSRVMFPEFVQVTFARDSFARLRKFNYDVVMINLV